MTAPACGLPFHLCLLKLFGFEGFSLVSSVCDRVRVRACAYLASLAVCRYTAHFVAEAQKVSVEGSPLEEAPASLDQIKSCINPPPKPNASSGPTPISKPLL